MQKMTFLKRDFFSAGPGNHCFSKKMIQTKVPDEDKIRAVLTVKEFPGFVTGKVTKNGFPLEASWVGHPVCTGMEILAWFLVEGKYYSHT